jgi:hypothetical protein
VTFTTSRHGDSIRRFLRRRTPFQAEIAGTTFRDSRFRVIGLPSMAGARIRGVIPPMQCPRCGSANIRRSQSRDSIWMRIALQQQMRCYRCCHAFAAAIWQRPAEFASVIEAQPQPTGSREYEAIC